MNPMTRGLEEEMLSGYLDRALTQQEEQRVRLLLEESAQARALLAELEEMRTASLGIRPAEPVDLQWDERSRSPGSRVVRWLGIGVAVIWLLGAAFFGIREVVISDEPAFEKWIVLGFVAGPLLLLFSVLADRLRDLPNDRYRRVRK